MQLNYLIFNNAGSYFEIETKIALMYQVLTETHSPSSIITRVTKLIDEGEQVISSLASATGDLK